MSTFSNKMDKTIFAAALAAIIFVPTSISVANAGDSPQVIKKVAPSYPRSAQRRNIEGTVTLSYAVNADGRVTDVQVVTADTPGVFDKAAITALEKWRYEAGTPATALQTKITFQLADG